MKKLTALLAALLATACGNQKLDPAEIRSALPDPNAVKITQPAPSSARLASPVPLRLAAAPAQLGQPAELAVTSYAFALSLNLGVGLTLFQLELVTALIPPTSCTDTACTWGPGAGENDVNRWMLVVTRSGEGYDYVLSGQPLSNPSAAFTPVISGTAFPGPTRPQGHGSFTVDFDRAWAELDHRAGEVRSFGTLAATYDGRGAMRLGVVFTEGRNDDHPGADPQNPNRANARYDFTDGAAGGELKLGWRTVAPFSAEYISEDVKLRTRWAPGGAGRGDIAYHNANLTYAASQCWDGRTAGWGTVFDGMQNPAVGDETACAYDLDPSWTTGFEIP